MTATAHPPVEHAAFCLPRAGEVEPRMESFAVTRTDSDGKTVGYARTTRCIECGEQRVDG